MRMGSVGLLDTDVLTCLQLIHLIASDVIPANTGTEMAQAVQSVPKVALLAQAQVFAKLANQTTLSLPLSSAKLAQEHAISPTAESADQTPTIASSAQTTTASIPAYAYPA